MTIAQFVRDLDEVVELVRRRFHKRKVVLVGHSWGTVLGTIYAYEHPEKVAVYVGVAQISDKLREAAISCEFALANAQRRRNHDAIEELARICPAPQSVDDRLALGSWVERFGGMFRGNLSTGKLIWAALTTDEANLIDLVKFGQGNRFSLEQLNDEFSRVNLPERYRSFQVPIFLLWVVTIGTSPRCWGKNISRSSRRHASGLYGSSSPRTTRPSRNRKNSTGF